MCGLEFDDPAEYARHLGEEHALYDDEGRSTDFGELAVPPSPAAPPEPAIDAFARPERSKEAPEMGRPIGLVAFVVLLLGVLGAMIALTGRGGDDEIAADGDTVRTRSASGSEPTDAPSTPGTATPPTPATATAATSPSPDSSSSAPPPRGSSNASPLGDVAGGEPNAIGSTPTTPPPPSTTLPPSSFTAPSASGARVESCQRVRNEWHVTYTWSFSGGELWQPAAAYTTLGGSRYQHTIAVPRKKDAEITTVYVTDDDGRRHPVSLQPRLSTASC